MRLAPERGEEPIPIAWAKRHPVFVDYKIQYHLDLANSKSEPTAIENVDFIECLDVQANRWSKP